MKNVCVFCGSSKGKSPIYLEKAKEFGDAIVSFNYSLVYGGGNMGLMGSIAKRVFNSKKDVYGFIPKAMLQYIDSGSSLCTEVTVCESMHDRKTKMYDKADAFVAVSGGIGTLEEFFEILTWRQLEYHNKPIALYNIDGFFDPIIDMIKKQIETGFVKQEILDLLIVEDDATTLLNKITNYKNKELKHKWNENDKI